MPYNVSLSVVERWQEYLKKIHEEVMIAGRVLKLKTNKPQALAYQLREALHAAQKLNIEPYNMLDVVVKYPSNTNTVIVERKNSIAIEIEIEESQIVHDEFINPFGVVSFLMTREPESVIFNSFDGDPELVENFCEEKDYEIINREPLTIIKKGDKHHDQDT